MLWYTLMIRVTSYYFKVPTKGGCGHAWIAAREIGQVGHFHPKKVDDNSGGVAYIYTYVCIYIYIYVIT